MIRTFIEVPLFTKRWKENQGTSSQKQEVAYGFTV